jgi:hypothetical protein
MLLVDASGASQMPTTQKQEAVKGKQVPPDQSSAHPAANQGEDGHIGATENEVTDVPAPSGKEFDDEPRQG